ncbi:hypothetical protein QBZ16_005218 [Prototheca wickerhamii]|uniref:UBX domain-containing protein n=1 Tax=Prototheca wickerhamii TaxID=3111 RepID=A0AAD9IGW6_PROWI|nr:hypothetical protein QBZ16_005218 [Prototheca wickerhamii]
MRIRSMGQSTFTRAFKSADEGSAGSSGLAASFEPPRELIFAGDLDEAKQAALEKHQWMVLNVQSPHEFNCHRLNRDTWRDQIVSDLIQQNFVFYQVFTGDEEGLRIMSGYRLASTPAILVVDPVTGAPMRTWTGFMGPDRLVEELLPFMEMSFDDPKAASLASKSHRAPLARRAGASSGSLVRGMSCSLCSADEEEELRVALQASLEAASQASAPSAVADMPGRAESGSTSSGDVAPEPEQVAAEARARLPPEPAAGFPDGSRVQRRFEQACPLTALRDLCLAQNLEAAGGRSFALVPAYPAPLDLNGETTLEAAGVANSMVVMKWDD